MPHASGAGGNVICTSKTKGGQCNSWGGASWRVVNVSGFQWEEQEGKVDLQIKENERCEFLGAHTRGSTVWCRTTFPWAQGHLLSSGHFSQSHPCSAWGWKEPGLLLVQVRSTHGWCYVTFSPAGLRHHSLAFPTASWPGWTHLWTAGHLDLSVGAPVEVVLPPCVCGVPLHPG